MVMPGRLEIRTTGKEHKHGSGWYLINQQIQPFEGRRIGPMQVFQNKEYRLMFSEFQEDDDDGFQGHLALTLGRDVERSIAVFRKGKRKYRRKQRDGFSQGKSVLAQHLF